MATSMGNELLAMTIEPSGKPISNNGTGRCAQAFNPNSLNSFPISTNSRAKCAYD